MKYCLLLVTLMSAFLWSSCDDSYDYVTEKEYREREALLLEEYLTSPTVAYNSVRDSLKLTALDFVDSLDNENLGWAIYWHKRGTGTPVEVGDEIGVSYRDTSIIRYNEILIKNLKYFNESDNLDKSVIGSFTTSYGYITPFYIGLQEAMVNASEVDKLVFRYGDVFTMLLPTSKRDGSYGSSSYISLITYEIKYVKRPRD